MDIYGFRMLEIKKWFREFSYHSFFFFKDRRFLQKANALFVLCSGKAYTTLKSNTFTACVWENTFANAIKIADLH